MYDNGIRKDILESDTKIIKALDLSLGMFRDLAQDEHGDCRYCLNHLEYTVFHDDDCSLMLLENLLMELTSETD